MEGVLALETISIDIETYSGASLQRCGVYRYAEEPDFEVLLFAYSTDGSPVRVIDLACGEEIPQEVLAALADDSVTKWAFNANFERVCLSRYLRDLGLGVGAGSAGDARYLDPRGWCCSMVWTATMGLPLSLESAGAVLGIDVSVNVFFTVSANAHPPFAPTYFHHFWLARALLSVILSDRHVLQSVRPAGYLDERAVVAQAVRDRARRHVAS